MWYAIRKWVTLLSIPVAVVTIILWYWPGIEWPFWLFACPMLGFAYIDLKWQSWPHFQMRFWEFRYTFLPWFIHPNNPEKWRDGEERARRRIERIRGESRD